MSSTVVTHDKCQSTMKRITMKKREIVLTTMILRRGERCGRVVDNRFDRMKIHSWFVIGMWCTRCWFCWWTSLRKEEKRKISNQWEKERSQSYFGLVWWRRSNSNVNEHDEFILKTERIMVIEVLIQYLCISSVSFGSEWGEDAGEEVTLWSWSSIIPVSFAVICQLRSGGMSPEGNGYILSFVWIAFDCFERHRNLL